MPTKEALIEYAKKGAFDDIYTPEYVVEPLLDFIQLEMGNEFFMEKVVWECADPGGSKITSAITKRHGFVLSTDIKNGHDFLEDGYKTITVDMIITNPPYSLKDRWLERCYEIGKPFALLLPLTALEGIKRNKLFSKYGISVMVLNKRVDFTGGGNNWFNVSWFMWNIGENNKLYFKEI